MKKLGFNDIFGRLATMIVATYVAALVIESAGHIAAIA